MRILLTRGLILRPVWLDRILAGTKTWEIRGTNTAIRGPIGLIASGSGTIIGLVDLIGTEFLTPAAYPAGSTYHAIPCHPDQSLPYSHTWAWPVARPWRFPTSIPYSHPQGSVRWVRLDLIVDVPRSGLRWFPNLSFPESR